MQREDSSFWFHQRIVTVGIVAPELSAIFNPNKDAHYLLEKIFFSWPTIGAGAPTAFVDITARIVFYSPSKSFNDIFIPVNLFTTPGTFENFTPNATPRNQQVLAGKSINWPLLMYTPFEIKIGGFQGASNPGYVDIFVTGKNIFRREAA